MLFIPKCRIRECIHFRGVIQPDGTELTERVICDAYPEGIPDIIAYGNALHLTVRKDQSTSLVYEKAK